MKKYYILFLCLYISVFFISQLYSDNENRPAPILIHEFVGGLFGPGITGIKYLNNGSFSRGGGYLYAGLFCLAGSFAIFPFTIPYGVYYTGKRYSKDKSVYSAFTGSIIGVLSYFYIKNGKLLSQRNEISLDDFSTNLYLYSVVGSLLGYELIPMKESGNKSRIAASILAVFPGYYYHGLGLFYSGKTRLGTALLVCEIISIALSTSSDYNEASKLLFYGSWLGDIVVSIFVKNTIEETTSKIQLLNGFVYSNTNNSLQLNILTATFWHCKLYSQTRVCI